jgi:hypothetical protein
MTPSAAARSARGTRSGEGSGRDGGRKSNCHRGTLATTWAKTSPSPVLSNASNPRKVLDFLTAEHPPRT